MWTEYWDDTKEKAYYYNKDTKETTWTKPVELATSSNANVSTAEIDDFLKTTKAEWRRADNDGRSYYYKKGSNEVQWEQPSELVEFLSSKSRKRSNISDHDQEVEMQNKRRSIDSRADDDFGDDFDISEDEGGGEPEGGDEQASDGGTPEQMWDAAAQGDSDDEDGAFGFGGGTSGNSESEAEAEDRNADDDYDDDMSVASLSSKDNEIKSLKSNLVALDSQLSARDYILEPKSAETLRQYCELSARVAVNDDDRDLSPEQIAKSNLISGFQGTPQLTRVLCDWSDYAQSLQASGSSSSASAPTSNSTSTWEAGLLDAMCGSILEHFHPVKAGLVNVDDIHSDWFEELLKVPECRRLLITLYDKHGDSALLNWCLKRISAAGFNKEIASIVQESDNFDISQDILVSTLKMMCSNDPAMLVQATTELKRLGNTAEYLYLYISKVLIAAETSLRDRRSDETHLDNDSTDQSERCNEMFFRIRRLREELEQSVVWERASESGSTLDTASLFNIKLSGLYVRKFGTSNEDILSHVMYECLDILRCGEAKPEHAYKLVQLYFGMQNTGASGSGAGAGAGAGADADADVDSPIGQAAYASAFDRAPVYYLQHPQIMNLLTKAFIVAKMGRFTGKVLGRYASLLALAIAKPSPEDDLNSLSFASMSQSVSKKVDHNELAILAVQLRKQFVFACECCLKFVSLSTQHGLIQMSAMEELVNTVKNEPDSVAAIVLLWAVESAKDHLLVSRDSSHQLPPLWIELAVQGIAKKNASLHARCYEVLASVISLKDAHTSKLTLGTGHSTGYTLAEARRDAWSAMLYLMGEGYIRAPIKLLESSLARLDADLLRHILRSLVHAIDTDHKCSPAFASQMQLLLKHSNVVGSIESEHFSSIDRLGMKNLMEYFESSCRPTSDDVTPVGIKAAVEEEGGVDDDLF